MILYRHPGTSSSTDRQKTVPWAIRVSIRREIQSVDPFEVISIPRQNRLLVDDSSRTDDGVSFQPLTAFFEPRNPCFCYPVPKIVTNDRMNSTQAIQPKLERRNREFEVVFDQDGGMNLTEDTDDVAIEDDSCCPTRDERGVLGRRGVE